MSEELVMQTYVRFEVASDSAKTLTGITFLTDLIVLLVVITTNVPIFRLISVKLR